MNINFEWWLTWAVIILGAIALMDRIFWAKKRTAGKKEPLVIEWAHAFWPVLLLVLLLRSFLMEPFRIPSGSLEPTLLIGDFVLVNKFDYGLRLPVLHTKIWSYHEPKRGDIVVFRSPISDIDMIKRVIAVPGDRVSYINKTIYVNGKPAMQTVLPNDKNHTERQLREEDLFGIKHDIYQNSQMLAHDMPEMIVPPGAYFVMGDNRDNSNDSRYWGFVPENNLIGRAFMIVFSWNGDTNSVRWSRIGESIH